MSRPKNGDRRQPEGPDDAKHNHTIECYDSEWRDIKAAAEREGKTPGAWMRDLAVASARGQARVVVRVRYGYANSVSGRWVRIQTAEGEIEHEATGDQLNDNGWGWPLYCEFLRVEERADGSRTVSLTTAKEAAKHGPPEWAEYTKRVCGD